MTREQWQSIQKKTQSASILPWTVLLLAGDLFLLGASSVWIETAGWWNKIAAEILTMLALVQVYLILHEANHGAVCRERWLNGVAGHLCGWLVFLPFLTRQRHHLQHHAWAGHPINDPENRGIIERFASLTREGSSRMEFIWRYWIPLIAANSYLANWRSPFRARAGGDGSARIRKEIRFVRIYLAGYAVVLCAAAAAGRLRIVLCWYIPALIVQLMAVELLNLPHHAEAPVLPASAARLRYWEQEAVTHSCAALPVWSNAIILNFNLHIAHHAFPMVAWHQLPRIQKAMADCGPAASEWRMDEWSWSVANRKRPLLEVMKAYFVGQPPRMSHPAKGIATRR
jgi:acyl-lipid omega-6 desaturase (Delta-12 desaturase)